MFRPSDYTSLADLVTSHSTFLEDVFLTPVLRVIHNKLPAIRHDFEQLRESLLGKPLLNPTAAHQPSGFWIQSTKKDIGAQLRRFSMGTQARGLHVDLRAATTEEDHLRLALKTEHPAISAQRTLEPHWSFVFTNLAEAFHLFGVKGATRRITAYRQRVCKWLTIVRDYLAPVQKQLNRSQPPGPASVSAHVNTVFLYVLLVLTKYSNPKFAFKFFHGAPLVGEFQSDALVQREKVQGPFTDAAILTTAADCEQHCFRTVKAVLSPVAAKKAMDKMTTEFSTGTLRGPFDTKDQLREAIQQEIRLNPGFEHFVVQDRWIIISPQFSVEELHAYEEESSDTSSSAAEDHEPVFKVRNIWNAKRLNVLAQAYSTYVPNTHACVSTIVVYWLNLLISFGFPTFLAGYPADFKAAYRQMPVCPLHILFSASAYFHYEGPDYIKGRRRLAFYTSLPFGSSIAPGNWGETVVCLAWLMAHIVLSIITHCVDDVCSIETEELVHSSRETFLHLVGLLGLTLDMQKSILPSADFIYLGLQLLLPSRLTGTIFALKVPKARRTKLIGHLRKILFEKKSLTSGEASSMRGRLFFYAHWFQEARSYLSEFAARQYAAAPESALTEELILALEYFLHILQHDERFLAGIEPFKLLSREICWLYTDGSLEHNKTVKGIGGICFPSLKATPEWFGEYMNPNTPGYEHIAPIEMFAISRALTLFGHHLRGKALWLFCDNTHSVGCLLRRSSMVRAERQIGEKRPRTTCERHLSPEEHFQRLPKNLRRAMNELARRIWKQLSDLDILLWVEYVWTKVNLADAPSRGEEPCVKGLRVGRCDLTPNSFVKCKCHICNGD